MNINKCNIINIQFDTKCLLKEALQCFQTVSSNHVLLILCLCEHPQQGIHNIKPSVSLQRSQIKVEEVCI